MKFWKLLVCVFFTLPVLAQEPGPHDFGRMWTFENPPKAWFQEAYNFSADDAWFDHARKSSLRFATWCSASFVSPDGLLMTNHHCSRGEIDKLQHEGENFDLNGFYAMNRADERRAEGLFVEQLLYVEDITARIQAVVGSTTDDSELVARRQQAFQQLQAEYSNKAGWEGLRLQIVTYYSGGKFSMYGYRRYNDIRLVCIPELNLGFYGGDPDNFTYPRYTLDFTFWRVYDDNGQPVNSSANYFRFNEQGANENEPVFVIGNPGSTERYRTVSQLEYDRDYRYPLQVAIMKDQMSVLEEAFAANPSHELQEQIFEYSNSIKAISGILDGLNDPRLFSRKVAMEKKIRTASKETYWDYLTETYGQMGPQLPELQYLSPNPATSGKAVTLMHLLYTFKNQVASGAEGADLDELKSEIKSTAENLDSPEEIRKFAAVLSGLKRFATPQDTYIDDILNGRNPGVAATEIITQSDFSKPSKIEKLLDKKESRIVKDKDVFIGLADQLMPMYYHGVEYFQATGPTRRGYEEKIAKEVFKVYGDDLPPDATFTLRISDGVVRGYDYNGTTAPYKTTYFGMYDRNYSNDQKSPWELSSKWMNPSLELLRSPLNFVATTDIIGGNSGSPMINEKQEVVGLVFDGNIESLPSNFIFDEAENRTVAVHAGGIIAALRYVYHADALADELTGK